MDEGFENLRCAIMVQAVKDYRQALKFGGSRYGSRYTAESLEKWFLSDWGQMLSMNNGQRIIDEIKREVHSGLHYRTKRKITPRTNLMLFRENLGLSRAAISKIIGCSGAYYGQVENGVQCGSNDFWDKLQKAFPTADIRELMDNDR